MMMIWTNSQLEALDVLLFLSFIFIWIDLFWWWDGVGMGSGVGGWGEADLYWLMYKYFIKYPKDHFM